MTVIYASPTLMAKDGTFDHDINVFFQLVGCNKALCLQLNTFHDDNAAVIRKVIEKSGLQFHPEDLFMFWNGKPLDVEKLREGSTVMVSYRNRGGCFLVSFTILFMIGGALIASFFTCGLSLCAIPFLLPLLFILPLFCL